MPGKVNPVIAEAVCMVAAQVIGNDVTVTIAGQSGNFELNVMQPVAAYNLLQSINLLGTVTNNFREKLVDGLKATENGPHLVERGLSLCTALVPEIGYDLAASISHDAFESGETIRQVARKKTRLTDQDLERLLDPSKMTEPGSD
jgi:fumarate hydratase class II